jgi:hypothetical protein
MVRLLGIAGMVVHLGADVFRQVAELVVGGAAGVRCTPASGCGLAAGWNRVDYWQIHGSSSLMVTQGLSQAACLPVPPRKPIVY